MTLLQRIELAIGGPGTFDLDVYEAEAQAAMRLVADWLDAKGAAELARLLRLESTEDAR